MIGASATPALWIAVITVGVGYATALLYAGLGELLTERSGVINLGVEGLLLIGAVTAFWIPQVLSGPSWVVPVAALACAAAASALAAAVFAVVCVVLQGNQVVTGLAIAILGGAAGISTLAASEANLSNSASKATFGNLDVLGLKSLPVAGPLLLNYNILIYLSWALCFLVWCYLYRTHAGLRLRAVGESPAAADAMGISVRRCRLTHTIVGGAFAGLGGAYYTLALTPTWSNGMTAGAGFVAIALVIVASWRPGLLMVGSYLFGITTSVGATLQARGWSIAPEAVSAFPYVFTVLMLVIGSVIARNRPSPAPASLGENYVRT